MSPSDLVDVVQVGSFIGPVVVALLHPVFHERRQHDDDHAAVLPNHLQTRGFNGSNQTCVNEIILGDLTSGLSTVKNDDRSPKFFNKLPKFVEMSSN